MPDFIRIHPKDNVAVTLRPVARGTVFQGVTALEDIPQGHKMALAAVNAGENVVKYGFAIGHATADLLPGMWVHTHNMVTNLSGEVAYTYHPNVHPVARREAAAFQGYLRTDGRAGIRNETQTMAEDTRPITGIMAKM